jgi:two-component sensor histidine kinase
MRRWRPIEALAELLAATPRNWVYAFLISLLLVGLAATIRGALQPVLGMRFPFTTFYSAVTLAAVLGGYRAGVLALAASVLVGWWVFIEPRFSFGLMSAADRTGFVVFVCTAAFEGLMAATLRHAILQLRARDRDLRLVANELDHRVKNALGNVRSISRQIARVAPDVAAFEAAFEARLKALAAAHDLLARSSWKGAEIRELAGAHLQPFVSPDGPRLVMQGPDLTVSAEAASSLSLMLHELTTNAVKYGALSTPAGEVRLGWTRDMASGDVVLDWRERGGPKVEPPKRKGFGTTLIAKLLAGRGLMDFAPEGLHVIARVPAAKA